MLIKTINHGKKQLLKKHDIATYIPFPFITVQTPRFCIIKFSLAVSTIFILLLFFTQLSRAVLFAKFH